MSEAKIKLDALIHKELIDNNGNIIRKVKFFQTNLTGFNIRGGLATKEKTFIGFKSWIEDEKLEYERIDVANFDKIKKENDNSFRVFKNDVVFFVYPDGSIRGGKIVSLLEESRVASFSNSKYPALVKSQPLSFINMSKGKAVNHKQHALGKATGIIKLNLDILGNIKSYQTIGDAKSELLDFIKDTLQ